MGLSLISRPKRRRCWNSENDVASSVAVRCHYCQLSLFFAAKEKHLRLCGCVFHKRGEAKMSKLGNAALILAAMSYMIVVGADLFGQLVLTAMTFSGPPRSLHMYHGPVPYDSERFWQAMTMVVTFFAAIAVATNWTKPRRMWVAGFFIAWLALNAVSFAFVFPEYQAIQAIPYADYVDPELVKRAGAQELRGLVRSMFALAIGVLPFIALTIPRTRE